MNDEIDEKKKRALNLICYKRHRMHAKKERITDEKMRTFLGKLLPIIIGASGLPDYRLGENLKSCLGGAEGNEEYMVEKINELIEEWLRKVDEEYGTDYAPKGYARARYRRENNI